MKVEFLYFEGCPSYIKTLENLKEILSDEKIESELKLIKVESPSEAEFHGFQGSPSIRINGVDLEGKKDGYSYNCRLYKIDGKLTGIPGKEYILKRLKNMEMNNPADS